MVIFSSVEGLIFVFGLRRSKNFLLVLWWPASVRVDVVDLLVCIVKAHCALTTLVVLGGS
jgi:hypothetical protein